MTHTRRLFLSAAAVALLAAVPAAQPAVTSPRLYIFDTGSIKGLDPQLFHFTREELAAVDFGNVAYLIVHPRGTLMFDTGGIPDSAFNGDGRPVIDGVMSSTTPLGPQLASTGHAPGDIDYLALSHYHSDHTGNANAFAGATWIVQQADRDVMFGDDPQGIIKPAHYSALKTAKTHLLHNEDFDIFGDGTVVIKSAPGHTPGHQVLFLKLATRGPVLLTGDLYHYPEERGTDKTPSFEFNAQQSLASRRLIEAFAKARGAELWIEHDIATHARLPRAPAYLD